MLTLIFIMFGCGGDTPSKTVTDNNTSLAETSTIEDNSMVPTLYDYNSDTTAIRKLDNSQVNNFEDIDILLNSLKNNKEEFDKQIDKFVSEILSFNKPVDNKPSYAPRGENKGILINVHNNQIDYSSYILNGDVDGDYQVDFKDIALLKKALFENSTDSKYDVNNDGRLDIKDLIYTTARLNSEIVYFDFYDKDLNRLNIARRDINSSKKVVYNGKENKILVIAKDENGASGYVNGGLNDSNQEWYHKNGWVHTGIDKIIPKLSKDNSSNNMIINTVRDVINIDPDPYLLGWHLSVKYVEVGGIDDFDANEYGIESWRWFFDGEVKPKINSHFTTTNMNHPPKEFLSNMQFIYQIGSTNGKKNEVKAQNSTYKHHYTLDGEKVTIKRMVQATTVLFESKADKLFKGNINSNYTVKGKVTLERVGPTPKKEKFEGEVKDNEFEVKDVPFGAYDIEIETACHCKFNIAKNYIFDSETSIANLLLADTKTKANLTLTIVNSANNPQKNKTVEIEQKACLDQGTGSNSAIFSESGKTDSSGVVTFDSVFVGDYRVKVDGNYVQDIHFCKESQQNIIINPKWRLKVNMSSQCTTGSITFKKFTLDCNKPISLGGATTSGDFLLCGAVDKDFYDFRTTSRSDEKVEVSYSGGLSYDSGLSPLYFYEKGLTINAMNKNYCDSGMSMQVGVMYVPGTPYQSADHCNGTLPFNLVNTISQNKRVTWEKEGNGLNCNFVLEPCKDEECNGY